MLIINNCYLYLSSHIMIYREIVKWSGAVAWDPVLSNPSKLFQFRHEITVFIV